MTTNKYEGIVSFKTYSIDKYLNITLIKCKVCFLRMYRTLRQSHPVALWLFNFIYVREFVCVLAVNTPEQKGAVIHVLLI